jgi:hypothetical protein
VGGAAAGLVEWMNGRGRFIFIFCRSTFDTKRENVNVIITA